MLATDIASATLVDAAADAAAAEFYRHCGLRSFTDTPLRLHLMWGAAASAARAAGTDQSPRT